MQIFSNSLPQHCFLYYQYLNDRTVRIGKVNTSVNGLHEQQSSLHACRRRRTTETLFEREVNPKSIIIVLMCISRIKNVRRQHTGHPHHHDRSPLAAPPFQTGDFRSASDMRIHGPSRPNPRAGRTRSFAFAAPLLLAVRLGDSERDNGTRLRRNED